MPDLEDKKNILIKGARVNNLKNIDVAIPRNEFVVVTGLSGSGKSSLAYDTIYAEGQRRYVESLSAYARQFLGRIHKPEVDYIKGLPPAIAIEQKVRSGNQRSTVGTSTEIYDYLKLLFARVGKTFSPISGTEVKRHTVTDVINHILGFKKDSRVLIAAPYTYRGNDHAGHLTFLVKEGFQRVWQNGEMIKIDELINKLPEKVDINSLDVIIDRISVQDDEDSLGRYADSVETAFTMGAGNCIIIDYTSGEKSVFNNRFEADGIVFEEPSEHMFSFNNPIGACPRCEGYGSIIGIDENLVIPDKSLSIYQDAVVCWRGEKMSKWKDKLVYNAEKFGFPIHKPVHELTNEQRELLWTGNRWFKGLNAFFAHLEEKKYKIQYRVMLSRYRGRTVCPECRGSRLKKEAGHVKINGVNIQQLVLMPIDELFDYFSSLTLTSEDEKIAKRILTEIRNRLEYLMNVGLSYLTLNRVSSTLSGGETQRINLSTSLGSSLVGSLYILDEPSIGLHARDTSLLIGVLKNLKKIGNTVLVVEHDEEIITAADYILDIGPGAGRLGGEVVFFGTRDELINSNNSLTAGYLTGKMKVPVPAKRRAWNNSLVIQGAREHNLKNISVEFPLNNLTVVTGVSGSGKSTLVNEILYPTIAKEVLGHGDKPGEFDKLIGSTGILKSVEMVDQNPIGKSSRSNPVTYIKAYDEIRKLYAEQATAQHFNMKPTHFSFNVDGGRCDECQGEGIIRVEMQFMADVELICENCQGKRFKEEVLDVKYRGKNIYEVLEMTVKEAIEFFSGDKSTLASKIAGKLQPLASVGLGYVKLGQSSSTLSGGESQRVKLASFLGKEGTTDHTLFIFDEPTTGLHFHDIRQLLEAFNALIERGHSVIVIEHNMEVIKSADWIIDLGPEGGKEGGNLVFAGTPEELSKFEGSYTGKYLSSKLKLN
ncbi:MAG: excinuclease ABC subunit UvrA [Bacteroidales bacterium]